MPLIAGETRNTNVVARMTPGIVEAVDAEGLWVPGFEPLQQQRASAAGTLCILSNDETHNKFDVDAVGLLWNLFGFSIGGHVLAEAARDEVRAGRGLNAGWFDVLAWRTWVGLDAAQLGERSNAADSGVNRVAQPTAQ